MKLFRTILVLVVFTSLTFSQSKQWMQYFADDAVWCQALEGQYLWIGTDNYLTKLNTITCEKKVFLEINNIHSIAIDEQGNKWIGTKGEGLVKFDGKTRTVYTSSNSGLPGDFISAVAIDQYGNKPIGSYSSGFNIFNENGVVLTTDVKKNNSAKIDHYSLEQNYPNPFNPSTKISYTIPESRNVKLTVFDILGKEVTSLVNEYKSAGTYTINFNASALLHSSSKLILQTLFMV